MLLGRWRANSRVNPAWLTSLLTGNKTSCTGKTGAEFAAYVTVPKQRAAWSWSGSKGSHLVCSVMEMAWESPLVGSWILVTAPPSWTATVYLGMLPSLSGIFWNEGTPSSYLQPYLFIKPSCRDVYCSSPFVSIKIGKFHVISEGCLHITYGGLLKFVSSHMWHTLCLNCLFWLVLIYLKKIPFSSLDFVCGFFFFVFFLISCLGILEILE